MSWTPISKAYVFSTLFGDPAPVGVVNLRDGLFGFAYASSWLERRDAYPLDPLHLPLRKDSFYAKRLFGPLADSQPDSWGQRVILATHQQKPSNEIEWLLASRGRGVGAIAYSASRSKTLPDYQAPSMDDLSKVIEAMRSIQASEIITDPELACLVEYGSSFGGARPKTIIQSEGREWLAKLPRNDDVFDQVRVEAASLEMASEAGIDVPDFRLINIEDTPVLLVERFDRSNGHSNAHYLSGESVLSVRTIRETDFQKEYSYQGLATAIRKFSDQPTSDMQALFRRMVFNVSIANTDDHLKNYGFVYRPASGWALSPAFDLLPHPGQTNYHAIGVGLDGRHSTINNVMSRAGVFGVSEDQAHTIVNEVQAITRLSMDFYEKHGVPEGDARMLSDICNQRLVNSNSKSRLSHFPK